MSPPSTSRLSKYTSQTVIIHRLDFTYTYLLSHFLTFFTYYLFKYIFIRLVHEIEKNHESVEDWGPRPGELVIFRSRPKRSWGS